tara:strand:+ start:711 stop:920 length:210 start_codon:yes stop_codon:yes gene_type:complete
MFGFFAILLLRGINLLVLSRRRDQTLVIGDNVEVTVLEIKGGQVRLGINAPRAVPVHRGEIHAKATEES